jgi:hypothetical protein
MSSSVSAASSRFEVKLRPLATIDAGRLDRELDVRALEVVAPGARAEQPDPPDGRMLGEAAGEPQDQLAARAVRGQRRGLSSVAVRRDDSMNASGDRGRKIVPERSRRPGDMRSGKGAAKLTKL